ncbi:MAG TPA: ABC transporter permease [Longimicrobium sp.]|nr:ABC transporter permease [Longimicrobium sp.]
MRFREIFRFELAYQLRRASAWLCFAVLFAFSFWMMAGSRPTDETVYQNAPYGIAFATVVAGVIWLLIGASVAGEAAARDVQTRMHPLAYTAPVGKAEYLGGRFLAAFAANALVLLAVPAGILLGVYLPRGEGVLLGPFRPAAYLTAYGCITLPFAFAATAIQFWWATLSRRPMSSYLAGVLLFVTSTFVPLALGRLLGVRELAGLLDLVGIGGVVLGLGDSWSAAEKNTRLVGVEPTFVANRLIWLAVALGVLALTYLRFRLAHPAESTRPRRAARRREAGSAAPAAGTLAGSAPIAVPHVRQTFGPAMYARQALRIGWDSFRAIAKSRGGLVLLAAIPALLVLVLPPNLESFGVPLLPRTGYLLTFLTATLTNPFTPWVIVPLLIVLYAGELVWREREAGLGDITDAAPVPEWAVLLGKFLGLALVLAAWMALLALAGVLVQLRLGYHHFELGLYLRVLFGLQLPEYLLFALLALVVQAVVDQKYIGLLVALAAYASIAFASTLGVEHHLLVYGSGPAWSYSDMRGFGASLAPWGWFKLYWAGWALLLAVAARLLWARGREEGPGARLRTARRRFRGATAVAAAVAAGVIVGVGGFVFYNTNVLNRYRSDADRAARAAEYERRYGRYEGVAQPRLAGATLRVEIHPERRAVEIRGTERLVNRGAVPIDTLHVATVPGVHTGAVTFDRPATRVRVDDALGHRIYALRTPLQPGDSLRLGFEVRAEPRGFGNDGADSAVAGNGTFFTTAAFLPAIGYQPGRQLRRPGERKAHGLAPRPAVPPPDGLGDERIAFEAVVGTSGDQVAVAPGALRRAWTEGGRRYFHYAADAPVGADNAIFSARYAVREARWNGPGRAVAIRILHHPGHVANLDRMLSAARASLGRYGARFGPYPYGQLSLVEIPGVRGMHAYPGLITFQEGFSLFDVKGPRTPDFPFEVAAHEVAHQWWGIQLVPAGVSGAAQLLSESLAEYSAFQVLRASHGPDQLSRYLAELRGQYGVAEERADVPLLRANGSLAGYYRGPLAMYAVSEYAGEDRVNAALRRLLEKHPPGARPATSLDLYRELQAAVPDSLRGLLHDLFEANTYWELATERATARRTPAGAWQVTLGVRARKVVVGHAGVRTAVPMDDRVEIGVFAPAAEGDGPGAPLYLRMHRIRAGRQTITVTVPSRPARAGIDPRSLLTDVEAGDNLRKVEGAR